MSADLSALNAELERLRAERDELRSRATRAEEELRASRALQTATIESLPFDLWASDRDGYCFSQNSTARANWGDLLGKRPEDMSLGPEVRAMWLADNRRALAGETVHGDVTYPIAGETREIHSVLAPIRMGDAIVGTLGVNIDVTEHRRARAELSRALDALRASEEKLRLATAAGGIGLWSWEIEADVVAWSDTMCTIFGVPPGEAPAGREAYLAFVFPDDRAQVAARIARGVQDGGWSDTNRIVRRDGAVRWINASGRIVEERGRRIAVGSVVDVTERRLLDEQLRQAQKLEAVGQLTAGIAHNFNNMLMGIVPNLRLAAERASPETAALLTAAEHSAARAADLVRQLMTYAGRGRPAIQAVAPVAPLVERAVALCRTTFDRRITMTSRSDPAAFARIDASQIEQALLNVLINARDALTDARGPEPRIDVDVTVVGAGARELSGRSGAFVRIRVRDNGPGMDAATAARIYEPFFTTKEVGRGTGLGLATTDAILREHGGFIACETAPQAGTTFSLYVPFDDAVEAPAPAPDEPAAAAHGSETILVVDDEPSVRRVVEMMLRQSGFSVRLAGSGQEALTLLRDARTASEIALVLLDVSMPGMSARDLRDRLRGIVPRAKIVYFTGFAYEAADPDDAVIEKPASAHQLIGTIRSLLDGPRGAPLTPP